MRKAAVVVVAALFAACSHSHTAKRAAPTTAVTPATTTVATTTSTTTRPGPPACTIAELAVTAEPTQSVMSHGGAQIRFTNNGPGRCVISGYPGVAAMDAAGHPVGDARRTLHGFIGGAPQGSQPPVLELRQHETASALVESLYQGSAPAPCPEVAALVVTPPGETHSVRLAVQMYGCELEVHPIVPGASGGLGT